jgi:hypothetical protein
MNDAELQRFCLQYKVSILCTLQLLPFETKAQGLSLFESTRWIIPVSWTQGKSRVYYLSWRSIRVKTNVS